MSVVPSIAPFTELVALAHADGLTIARALARTTAALGDGVAARPDETWRFDPEAARFSVTASDGEVLFGGPCRPIGSYSEGTFTWAAGEGPAVPDPSGELAAWLSQRSLAVEDESDARLVATGLAARAGYTGCFAQARGEARDYFAVQLTGEDAVGQGNRPWCSACGTMQRAAGRILAAGEGIALCDACGEARGGLIVTGPAGICHDCAGFAVDVLRGA